MMRLGSVNLAFGGVLSWVSYCMTRNRFSSETTSMFASELTAIALKLGFGSLMNRSGGRSIEIDFRSPCWPWARIPWPSQAMIAINKSETGQIFLNIDPPSISVGPTGQATVGTDTL